MKKIETDIDTQTVTVTYDADKTTVDKIIEGFTRFGYTARQLKPGETVAETTEECTNM